VIILTLEKVLDWIVTEKLYHAEGKKYSPGHMHLRKSAVVNTHFLAYISLRSALSLDMSTPRIAEDGRTPLLQNETRSVHLFQCMLHSSTRVLDDQENTFARYNKLRTEIETAVNTGAVFPWALLTRLQAPKFFSDVVEALLGAIWLDSEGSFDVVKGVLAHLGILPVLDRIIDENVDVQHPVSRLALWASREYKKIQYIYEKDKGNITCAIIVHHYNKEKEQICEPSVILRVKTLYKGRRAEDEARFHAAEIAVDSLKVKTVEEMIEEDLLLELDMEGEDDNDEDGEDEGVPMET
jgi:endoribonuclease Dicer